MTALENRIVSATKKIEVMDYRIGRMMSQRVALEDNLAKLYEQRNATATGKGPGKND